MIAFILTAAVCFVFLLSGHPLVLALVQSWAPQALIDAFASLSFYTHFQAISKGVIDLRDLVFFAAVIALLELRYFFWSRGQYDSRIILTQLGIVAVQTLIVATLPQHFWLPVSAIVMLAGTVLLLGMLFRTRNGPSVGASSIRATGR